MSSAALTEVCVLLSVILVCLLMTSLCVISGLDGGMCSTECHSSYPRRARSALGVDTVLTLDVCMYVCMFVCMYVCMLVF